jgi:hypothetical protein
MGVLLIISSTPSLAMFRAYRELPRKGVVRVGDFHGSLEKGLYLGRTMAEARPQKIRLINPKNRWSIVVALAYDETMSESVDIEISTQAGYAIGLKQGQREAIDFQEVQE